MHWNLNPKTDIHMPFLFGLNSCGQATNWIGSRNTSSANKNSLFRSRRGNSLLISLFDSLAATNFLWKIQTSKGNIENFVCPRKMLYVDPWNVRFLFNFWNLRRNNDIPKPNKWVQFFYAWEVELCWGAMLLVKDVFLEDDFFFFR